MQGNDDFDLKDFLPYLLNQAADTTSRAFEAAYKQKYGMLRTEWRVLFHLGRYGPMTAKEICNRARTHKTKVSRAVHALAEKRYLNRKEWQNDRRHETLSLTKPGQRVYEDLLREAQRFDAKLLKDFSDTEKAQIRDILIKIAKL